MLLKLSGEALVGDQPYGVDPARVEAIARDVTRVRRDGVETAPVIGAGNIHRGLEAVAEGMDRTTADYAGTLATVLTCLTQLEDVLAGKQLERAPYRVWVLSTWVVKMNLDSDAQYAYTRAVADHMFVNYAGVMRADCDIGDRHAYDPRAWGRNAEQAMAARVVEACRQLGSARRSRTGR